ncbi:hypothetical protein [Ligilactobacillus acidipiscis]|jgi:hypothetical protein|uniref:hypothetical protein n=1 Tax=Ligilactobacillus acidipiscis TaxID=89059 RepID=UPI0022E8E83D|nr:hypothetical protein [Ligilactobacillus acidipiscis]
MAYEKQTWGTYQYDESKSLAENITAAETANALVTTDKIKHIEDGIAEIELTPGPKGADGKAGASIKSIKLTKDEGGLITGGTATLTDNTTAPITVE